MSGNEKRSPVPRLRFPEFREAGEWKPCEIGPFLEEYSARVPASTDLPIYSSTRTGLKLQKDYYDNRELANEGEYGVVPEGYFVYRHMSDDGTFKFNINNSGERIAVSKEYPVFSVVEMHPDFLLYLLNEGDEFKKFAQAQKNGGTRTRLYLSVLRACPVLLPSDREQQKIADCLTSLDDRIAAEATKLDTLKAHKKGLMQQLFPAEGETVPRLRFGEFREGGEWERDELSSCLEKVIDYRGKAPPKSESGVPLITARNVRFGWLDMSSDEYIEVDEYDDWMSKGIPKAGDILFTTEAPLGNVAFFPSIGKFALGQRIITLRTKPNKCFSAFLYQSLLSPRMQKEIDFCSTGSTAKGIKSAVFVNVSFCYPGIEEQQKIADCLSFLDNLITAHAQKIELLKRHKKGLMQQLFPSTEGEIQV
ncbi:MAG: restriction endonuclease subunit S [Magnetococcus sp. DMHC-1]